MAKCLSVGQACSISTPDAALTTAHSSCPVTIRTQQVIVLCNLAGETESLHTVPEQGLMVTSAAKGSNQSHGSGGG